MGRKHGKRKSATNSTDLRRKVRRRNAVGASKECIVSTVAMTSECTETNANDVACLTYESNRNASSLCDELIRVLGRMTYDEQIKIGFSKRQLILIQGPMGCGKTSIVQWIANEMSLKLTVVQMSDEIDSKSLFGSFQCLDFPGDIVWKPSVFAREVGQRGIILIEDIDCASSDLISCVLDLVENRRQNLSSGEIIHLHDEAFLVATMRTPKEEYTPFSFHNEASLASISFRIVLPAYTDEEMIEIIGKKYKSVANYTKTLLKIFNEIVGYLEGRKTYGRRISRKLTKNDLLRACNRLNSLDSLSDGVFVLHELIDTWAVHSSDELTHISRIISKYLSVNYNMLNSILNLRQPDLSLHDNKLVCGRVELNIQEQALENISKPILFAKTREVCRLIERIAACIGFGEAVLLTGETGVGKTLAVQAIAHHVNANLRVVNLSPQSDSSDLMGGYKPVSILSRLQYLRQSFDSLFAKCFDSAKNVKFYGHIEKCLSSNRYEDYVSLIIGVAKQGIKKFSEIDRRKAKEWSDMFIYACRLRKSLRTSAMPFAFIKGIVAEAVRNGDWLLVDEINLAPVECLDAIVHIIDDPSCHNPTFRLFACMNPATDVMKRNLPIGIRSRFTEIFVGDTTEVEQLVIIGATYLPSLNRKLLHSSVDTHIQLCKKFPGVYSLRTLCRAFMSASDNIFGSDVRNLYEALAMSYMTNHTAENLAKVEAVINEHLNVSRLSFKKIDLEPYIVEVEGYGIRIGPEEIVADNDFIITPTVSRNMSMLARVVCSGKYPVLLEGETSTGKTSIIIHLAKITGNTVLRINNHEHTDLQEYIGSYAPDNEGHLVFVEGALLKAVRSGYWVILDELNLAPGDVIEALNRLLDDNREIFVPELNVNVKAHKFFRLFATQNPFATYSGRKRLSSALLNRFVVLKFDNLPLQELYSMVHKKCKIAESSVKLMIAVLKDLRVMRSCMGIFSACEGLMTLRDVFKWANRFAKSEQVDWKQCLANHGYMLLCSRCRTKADEDLIKNSLEHHIGRRIQPNDLFSIASPVMPIHKDFSSVVLTSNMRRMLVLCSQAWLHDEPVLMVGETGCGKTTVAQLLSEANLLTLNCHERTDTFDFLGSLRPQENGTFKWKDGVVLVAMREGRPLLIDEISLASDSVLERLNPVLEPSRTLLLTDSGTQIEKVVAKAGFNVIATMNPGGDYGKKELSKALRNRFTEIWCPTAVTTDDVKAIIAHRLAEGPQFLGTTCKRQKISSCMATFLSWYSDQIIRIARYGISIRDIRAFTDFFMRSLKSGALQDAFWSICEAFLAMNEGISVTASTKFSSSPSTHYMLQCYAKVTQIMSEEFGWKAPKHWFTGPNFSEDDRGIVFGRYHIEYGSESPSSLENYVFETKQCQRISLSIARALSIDKPILIQGDPGCGKSTAVIALAARTGHRLTRINLSEQTELCDLFGRDVPVILEDGRPSFVWRDGPLLTAIKLRHWILLDEMNLASQCVLEGLNACFDHRHQLYVPEIDITFDIGSDVHCAKFFACQNPHTSGGNRRALPKSFINRFTLINLPPFKSYEDYYLIASQFHGISSDALECLNNVSLSVLRRIECDKNFAKKGGPYEYNIRDLLRWSSYIAKYGELYYPFELLYVQRLRTPEDREMMRKLFKTEEYMCFSKPLFPTVSISEKIVRIGKFELSRASQTMPVGELKILPSQVEVLEHLAACVCMNWVALIVGDSKIGKSSVVKLLAEMTGNKLKIIRLNSETDASELIGSYEQMMDVERLFEIKLKCIEILVKFTDLVCDVQLCDNGPSLWSTLLSISEIVDDDTSRQLLPHIAELQCIKVCFNWINSAFVDAYKNGHWILFRDVNCCSAAVLDRLNACFEPGGTLVVTESGTCNESIVAHPNFRAFFTMNDSYGQISQAMRNRSVEIFLLPERNAWYRRLADRTNVVFPQKFYADGVCTLPSTLEFSETASPHSFIMLNCLLDDIDVVEALQLTSTGTLDDEYKEGIEIIEYPKLSACHSLDIWKMKVWKYLSDEEPETGLMWAVLSASSRCIKMKTFIELFCDEPFPRDSQFIRDIVAICESDIFDDSLLPFDSRFDGLQINVGKSTEEEYRLLDRLIVKVVYAWCDCKISMIENTVVKPIKSLKSSESRDVKLLKNNRKLEATIVPIKKFLSSKFHSWNPNTNIFSLLWDFVLLNKFSWNSCDGDDLVISFLLAQRIRKDIEECFTDDGDELYADVMRSLRKIWTEEGSHDFESFLDFYIETQMVLPYKSAKQFKKDVHAMEMFQSTLKSRHHDREQSSCEGNERNSTNCSDIFQSAMRKISDICQAYAYVLHIRDAKDVKNVIEHGQKYSSNLLYSSLLEWESQTWASTALLLEFLCSDFLVQDFNGAKMNFDLVLLPLATEIILPVLNSLNFDSSLRNVIIKQLDNFASTCKTFKALFWMLEGNLKEFASEIKGMLFIIVCHLKELLGIDESNEKSDQSTLPEMLNMLWYFGLKLLKKVTPPNDFIDPSKYLMQEIRFISEKEKLLSSQSSLLCSYCEYLFGTAEDTLLPNQSSHPFLSELINRQTKFYVKRGQEKVFRSSSSDFSCLANELISFTKTICDWQKESFNQLDCNAIIDISAEQLSLKKALHENFLTSAKLFYERLTTDFGTFPDITRPYTLFLQCCMLSVAYDLKVITQKIAALSLQMNASLPVSSLIKEELYFQDFYGQRSFEWCLSNDSSMPVHIQIPLASILLDERRDAALHWLHQHWSAWYKRNADQKEIKFIYCSSRKKCDSDADEDTVEMDLLLPNYSDEEEIDFPVAEVKRSCLYADELLELIVHLEDGSSKTGIDKPDLSYIPVMWLCDYLKPLGLMKANVETLLLPGHYRFLSQLSEENDDELVDVYHKNNRKQLLRCTNALSCLSYEVRNLKETWSEMATLDAILRAINKILVMPGNTPILRLSALMERVLDECEHWEKVASRKNSLNDVLTELRKLLLDWRRMEVLCWEHLFAEVQSCYHSQALLMSWPLFDVVSTGSKSEEEIITMLIAWLQQSSLGDFEARLRSVSLLRVWWQCCAKESDDTEFCSKLTSVLRYFEQFKEVCNIRYRTLIAPIEKELKNHVAVAKFTDLNSWSVKQSAKKNHQHLFRLVKQFKLCLNESLVTVFDELLPISSIPRLNTVTEYALIVQVDAGVARAKKISHDLIQKCKCSLPLDDLMRVLEETSNCVSLMQEQIIYTGSDEDKEKQLKSNLNVRQKVLSRLLKEVSSLGVCYKKGLNVDGEKLTCEAVTSLSENTESDRMLRQCCASRSSMLKALQKPSVQLNSTLIPYLKGISEYVFNELLGLRQTTCKQRHLLKKMTLMRDSLSNQSSNISRCEIPSFCHSQRLVIMEAIRDATFSLCTYCENMWYQIRAAPSKDDINGKLKMLELIGLEPSVLSFLTTDSPLYHNIVESIISVYDVVSNFSTNLCSHIGSEHQEERSVKIWKKSEIEEFIDRLNSSRMLCEAYLERLMKFFPKQSASCSGILENILRFNNLPFDVYDSEICNCSLIEQLQLIIQNLYKKSEQIDKGVFMVTLKRMLILTNCTDMTKLLSDLFNVCKIFSNGGSLLCEPLGSILYLCNCVIEIYNHLLNLLDEITLSLSQYFLHFESLCVQLLQKGYVNTIPKIEKCNENGQGKMMESDDVAGMGDGQGDNDVGGEMDNMGQIEGLKGENEKEGEPEDNDENCNTPIDIDDEFLADLEKIDGEHPSDESEEENNDEDMNLDLQMGEVDDSEENKIDPNLWESEQKNEDSNSPKDIDEGKEGINKQTENLAAKDDQEHAEGDAKKADEITEDHLENVAESEPPDSHAKNQDIFTEEQDLPANDQESVRDGSENSELSIDGDEDELNMDEKSKEFMDDDDMCNDPDMEKGDQTFEADSNENISHDESASSETGCMDNDQEIRNETEEISDAAPMEIENSEGVNDMSGGMEYNEGVEYKGNADHDAENSRKNEFDEKLGEAESSTGGDRVKEVSPTNDYIECSVKGDENPLVVNQGQKSLEADLNADELIGSDELVGDGEEVKETESAEGYSRCEGDVELDAHKSVMEVSSVHEARLSRSIIEKLRDAQNEKDIERIDADTSEKTVLEDDMSTFEIGDRGIHDELSVIQTSVSFSHLAESIVSSNTCALVSSEDLITGDASTEKLWTQIENSISEIWPQLAENLRIIIEPTKASKLEGDYRSGKRLNMRRLIPYIASDYRKNRIWMRRTKCAKRNYQVLIAVDDSASMADSNLRVIACQSVCMIDKALNRLEIGQLAFCKFGKDVKMLSDFGSHGISGPNHRILAELTFKQDKTDLVNLLTAGRMVMNEAKGGGRCEQIIIIVSDGRDVFSNNIERLTSALSALHNENVIVLFVAMDNGESSLMDMTIAKFPRKGSVELVPYMNDFPFPFYVLVRHISALPGALAEGIRQWFELTKMNV